MIPPHVIMRLREAVDLKVLASEYVSLKRSGSELVCACPIHQEDTPSCRVSRTRFHCFGCGAHGSAIDWLMQLEGLRFAEAAQKLSERTGISLEDKPVSRVAMQYAREEAEFCKWWLEDRRMRLRSYLDEELARDEPDYAIAEALGKPLWWSPTRAEAFEFFRKHSTSADRTRWRASAAHDRMFTDMFMAMAGERKAA